jgi:hypothetical protein
MQSTRQPVWRSVRQRSILQIAVLRRIVGVEQCNFGFAQTIGFTAAKEQKPSSQR